LKGKIRWLKYHLLKIRYNNYIDFIAATGELGTLQYRNIGFDERKIFEWGYFVESSELSINKAINNEYLQYPSILFVGSIDDRKNIIPQINIIKKFEDRIRKMTIVGDGSLKVELKAKIQGYSIFDYKGNLPNNEVKKLMSSHDILILPSKFDGWGAVVNEALHAGMQVIASENCGASALLDGETRGEKFEFKGKNDFEQVLLKWINKGSLTQDERHRIANWSKNHISGKVVARYFEQIVDHVFTGNSERPSAPWLNEYETSM
jgi:glycosyltransferase involved in cell wall biosynthesis